MKVTRIACITKERAAEIFDSISEGNRKYSPEGLFVLREGDYYVGIANDRGDAWTEQFTRLVDCINWLRGDADLDDIRDSIDRSIYCPSCHKGSYPHQWECADGNDIELDLIHEIENDDEGGELWIHCPICGAQVAIHMIIEENQGRIGWMSWKQEAQAEPDEWPTAFAKRLKDRSFEVERFTRFLRTLLPLYPFLAEVLDGLDTYIRDGIDQDEPYNIVQTIKHQQEALHSLRAEKDSFAGSTVRLAKQVDTLLGQLKDAGKNISKRDQKIAELENLRAADRANAPHLLDELRKAKEEIGKLSSLKDVLVDGINKAESKANRVSLKLHIITEAIQQFTEENEKQ